MSKDTNTLLQINDDEIKSKIYAVRGLQVMLDSDLAQLYNVETKVFNQAVKRNIDRFPESFRFQLEKDEYDSLRSQFVTLKSEVSARGQHRKYLPFVFTEQGVAMLSAVLKSDVAVKVSIQIMSAFVNMRQLLQNNSLILDQIVSLKQQQNKYQIETDQKFEKVFNALGEIETPKQGVFFDGQVYDAYSFVCSLVKMAKTSITIIDNYIDDSILTLLLKRKKGVKVTIYTYKLSKAMQLDLDKHNEQYPPVDIQILKNAHDRFVVLDNVQVYHIGASLKDLGKKWFAFSKIEAGALDLINKISSFEK